MRLVIVDTECANLSSVVFAFERLGASPLISSNPDDIQDASHVILPGVGAAPFAIDNINRKGLHSTLQRLTQPVMGICLGMQILFESLEEGGERIEGLGLIKGHVGPLDTKEHPSPHMGWNTLSRDRDDPILDGISDGDHAYFVHSYAAPISQATLMRCTYGTGFSAIVRQRNIYGCQFHPERSSEVGAKILANFLKVGQ